MLGSRSKVNACRAKPSSSVESSPAHALAMRAAVSAAKLSAGFPPLPLPLRALPPLLGLACRWRLRLAPMEMPLRKGDSVTPPSESDEESPPSSDDAEPDPSDPSSPPCSG